MKPVIASYFSLAGSSGMMLRRSFITAGLAILAARPEVPPEAVRTLVVACCRHCRAESPPRSRAAFCSGRCRAAWHRHRHEETLETRDRQIRALVEAALRKLAEVPG